MFRRYWHIGFAVGLIALCYPPAYAGGADSSTAKKHHKATKDSKPVNVSALQNDVVRISRDIETLKADQASDAEQEKANRDLAERNYNVSLWTLRIGFFSLLVTTLGTWAIWDTLKHTAKAAEIGVLNSRPWVDLEPTKTKDIIRAKITRENGKAWLHIPIVWKNIGQIPATHFHIKSRFYQLSDPQQPIGAYREIVSGEADLGWTVFPDRQDTGSALVEIPPVFSGEIGLIMVGLYKMAGAKKVNATPVVCKVLVSLILDEEVLLVLMLDTVEGINAT